MAACVIIKKSGECGSCQFFCAWAANMKIFLSWSGQFSRDCAAVLYEWLPTVFQNAKPYMSAKDIEKGDRWSIDIATELADTNYGVICVTSDNIAAPWIMYESGALSKSLAVSRVSPILFATSPSDLVASPLLQFQATQFEKGEVLSLLKSINSFALSTEQISPEILQKAFHRGWPELESEIGVVLRRHMTRTSGNQKEKPVTQQEIRAVLEEILSNTRQQIKLFQFREKERSTPFEAPLPHDSDYWFEIATALQMLNLLIVESHDLGEHTKLANEGLGCVKTIEVALVHIQRSLYGARYQS